MVRLTINTATHDYIRVTAGLLLKIQYEITAGLKILRIDSVRSF